MTILIIFLIFIIPGVYIWADYYNNQDKKINLNFNNLSENITRIWQMFFSNIDKKICISCLYKKNKRIEKNIVSEQFGHFGQHQKYSNYSEIDIIKNLIYEIKNDFIKNKNKNKIAKTLDGWIYLFSPNRKIYIEKNKLSLFDLDGINRSIYVNDIHMKVITDFFQTIYIIANNKNN